jgi:parvulin-like peptidyl-prolyl isomerase
MRTLPNRPLIAAALFISLGFQSFAQAPTPPVKAAKPDALMVTVNGTKIFESEIEARFMEMVRQRSQGAEVPPEQLAQIRPQWHPMLLQQMVGEILLEADVKAAGIVVANEEYTKFFLESFDAQLFRQDMTRADFEELVKMREDLTVDAYVAREAGRDEFRATVRHVRLIVKSYPTETAVTDDEIRARYERDKEQAFTKETQVSASHILIGFDGAKTDEEKAAKRADAERILALCRADGADFAQLARDHSTGPSGPTGGVLGSFPRTGKMVEPFAKAAFELAVGEVSAVVETQFGYHLIKVTARQEGRVVPFEEVAAILETEVFFEKVPPLRASHVEKLKEKAEIVYP